MIDWNLQLRIPIRESTDAQAKHLVVKSLITLAIKLKYAKNLSKQRIYSEFKVYGDGARVK
jgi:hypothetical protein